MKNLREYAARHKAKTMKNNEDKLKHLRKKYRQSQEDKTNQIPESISDLGLEKLSIFDRQKYEDKVVLEYEPEIIGDITLHDNRGELAKGGVGNGTRTGLCKSQDDHQQRG